MCAIAGIVLDHQEDLLRNALGAMLKAQSHRGPDDAGETWAPFGDRRLGLGHRRLSIQDVSTAGHQPMIHPGTGDLLVFNGEIYNFRALRRDLESLGVRFAGHSDTEVLLHGLSRWGVDYLPKLQGMYALAFYRAQGRQLILARDPLGIKPLYVGKLTGGFAFSSEVRALLASGLVRQDLDPRGMAGMLAYGAVQHPQTLFEDIRSFPPGCYQIFEADRAGVTTGPVAFWYWPEADKTAGFADTVRQLQVALDETVRDHLAADVPVGVFLSSGIDSTIVAGLAGKHIENLRSFTVGFGDKSDLCEFEEAAETARRFGLRHTEVKIGHREAEEATVAWLQALDQPSMDGLNTFIISRAVRDQGIVVALSGLGGDELFGGYPSFTDVPRLGRVLRPLGKLPSPLKTLMGRMATRGKPESAKQKLRDMLHSDGSLQSLYLQRRRALSSRQMKDLGIDAAALGLDQNFLSAGNLEGINVAEAHPLWSVSQLESRCYMGNTLLRDSDANSMACGLEIRVPMLGRRVLELAASLPDAIRLPGKEANKPLLREAFPGLLRPALLRQPKKGFSLPIGRWMAGPLREQCEHSLAILKSQGLLRAGGIDAVWKDFLAAHESPLWSRAFALCVLGRYLEQAKGATLETPHLPLVQ